MRNDAEPRFEIFLLQPTNWPDSYGGGSIPANATNAFPLRNLRTSPISAINFGANVFPTPPISLTTEYSGKVLAISCIRDKIRPRVASTSLSTRTASVTSILTDEVSEGNVGILS